MFYRAANTLATIVACLGLAGAAVAQADSPQPSRNDPAPAAPNDSSKDTVPPSTDTSLPSRGGKQEPSSKIEGTDPGAVLVNGVLAVPGALADSQTAPAKFSERTNNADQLPIAAYSLGHLASEQRSSIFSTLDGQLALSGQVEAPVDVVVGSEVSADVALHGLQPIPEEVASQLPELRQLAFARAGSKIVLVNPNLHRVLAVLD
jgi:hypothetical protein